MQNFTFHNPSKIIFCEGQITATATSGQKSAAGSQVAVQARTGNSSTMKLTKFLLLACAAFASVSGAALADDGTLAPRQEERAESRTIKPRRAGQESRRILGCMETLAEPPVQIPPPAAPA